MKRFLSIISLFFSLTTFFAGCGKSTDSSKLLSRIDSLQKNLDSAYVPGTGEIMNGIIQPHHYKLYLAGQQQNWALAEYERHQLSGGFKRILKYHKHTLAANSLAMIYPEMDALETAIRDKNSQTFKNHFALLTSACNNCHQVNKQNFNVITVPSVPAFGNQQF